MCGVGYSHCQRFLANDFGLSAEFASVSSRCYEFSDINYIYSLCPFDQVTQRSKSTSHSVTIGCATTVCIIFLLLDCWNYLAWAQDCNRMDLFHCGFLCTSLLHVYFVRLLQWSNDRIACFYFFIMMYVNAVSGVIGVPQERNTMWCSTKVVINVHNTVFGQQR